MKLSLRNKTIVIQSNNSASEYDRSKDDVVALRKELNTTKRERDELLKEKATFEKAKRLTQSWTWWLTVEAIRYGLLGKGLARSTRLLVLHLMDKKSSNSPQIFSDFVAALLSRLLRVGFVSVVLLGMIGNSFLVLQVYLMHQQNVKLDRQNTLISIETGLQRTQSNMALVQQFLQIADLIEKIHNDNVFLSQILFLNRLIHQCRGRPEFCSVLLKEHEDAGIIFSDHKIPPQFFLGVNLERRIQSVIQRCNPLSHKMSEDMPEPGMVAAEIDSFLNGETFRDEKPLYHNKVSLLLQRCDNTLNILVKARRTAFAKIKDFDAITDNSENKK